jgi:hypothetical protein
MMVSNRGSVLRLLYRQWRYTLLFTLTGSLAPLVHHTLGWHWMKLPMAPLAIISTSTVPGCARLLMRAQLPGSAPT